MFLASDPTTLDPELAEQMRRYDRALEQRDLGLLDEILDEDYVQVSPLAIRRNRPEWFDWFLDIVRIDAMRRRVIGSRAFGDVTIVLSECDPTMRVRGGEPSVHQALMLEVWTRNGDRWLKAIEQLTRRQGREPNNTSDRTGEAKA